MMGLEPISLRSDDNGPTTVLPGNRKMMIINSSVTNDNFENVTVVLMIIIHWGMLFNGVVDAYYSIG